MAPSLSAKTEELVAIGAALAANCEPCLRYHVRAATEVGCSREEMGRAVEIAQGVKDTPARLLANLASRLLGSPSGGPGSEAPYEATAAQPIGSASASCCASASSGGGSREHARPAGPR